MYLQWKPADYKTQLKASQGWDWLPVTGSQDFSLEPGHWLLFSARWVKRANSFVHQKCHFPPMEGTSERLFSFVAKWIVFGDVKASWSPETQTWEGLNILCWLWCPEGTAWVKQGWSLLEWTESMQISEDKFTMWPAHLPHWVGYMLQDSIPLVLYKEMDSYIVNTFFG